MLIRCDRCRALFSLQEGPAGVSFRVECGRCLLVFDTPRETKTPTQVRPVIAPPRAPAPGVLERKAQADELAKALKPRRPEDEKGLLEQELLRVSDRRRRLLRIALGALAVVALAIGGLGLKARFADLPRDASARIEKARLLLLRDDAKSLEQATELFTEAARLAPGEAMPEAERGFSMLLQAAASQDLAARVTGQEREKYLRESTWFLQHGVAAAKAALEDDGQDTAALRGMALHSVLAGVPDQGALDDAVQLAPHDPWVLYVKALAQRKTPDAAAAALAVASQIEPRMLRAQVDLAALAMDRQEPGPARSALAKVLQENPNHERAKRLLSLLPAPPQ